MTTDHTDPTEAVKAEAEQIVAGGEEIRPRLTSAVAEAAEKAQSAGRGLLELAHAVMEGARLGLEKSVPPQPDDVLRQVVDALGDGISQAALAARLAVEEARSSGRHFADEDVKRLREDLSSINGLFTEAVSRTLKGCRTLTGAQFHNVITHAGRVSQRMGITLAAVLDAACRDPLTLGKEGLVASVSTGRHAAGALFGALGGMLQRAGERLRQDSDRGTESS